jgi:hypothetical protein
VATLVIQEVNGNVVSKSRCALQEGTAEAGLGLRYLLQPTANNVIYEMIYTTRLSSLSVLLGPCRHRTCPPPSDSYSIPSAVDIPTLSACGVKLKKLRVYPISMLTSSVVRVPYVLTTMKADSSKAGQHTWTDPTDKHDFGTTLASLSEIPTLFPGREVEILVTCRTNTCGDPILPAKFFLQWSTWVTSLLSEFLV